ncbi:SHOCT domain-containing protein [Amycolatopsis sp. NPDC049253]|uniref:SHOCT domain-containing protein n=1 Tax=Amycolatopsis sp. NPDC049253 TaxID=3155274 RepID=UPI003435B0AE
MVAVLVLLAVLTAAGVVTAVLLRRTPKPTSDSDRALGILRERFARGEIGQDEYERRRETLGR